MKILMLTGIKKYIGMTIAAGTLTVGVPVSRPQQPDIFEHVVDIPPSGTSEEVVLKGAPSPKIAIEGEEKNAEIVVDLARNILYHYDENGEPLCAYLVASGKKNTPTDTGVRVVTHIESYPYRNAPIGTKRRRTPGSYGPKIICLQKLDPETGLRSSTGEFIHGTNKPESIGKYASLGCIRMDNTVIKELASQVKRGAIVIIKK